MPVPFQRGAGLFKACRAAAYKGKPGAKQAE